MTDARPGPAGEATILGVRVQGWTVQALHAEILRLVRSGAHALILNVNVHALNLAWREPWLRDFFNSAPVVFCDGAGVRLAARILGRTLPPRITYADWIWDLAAFATAEKLSIFLLGGRANVAENAARNLRARFPDLRVAGHRHGYFDQRHDSIDGRAVVREINDVRPDILVLALGMPLQERWLSENWSELDAGVALTGGAVLDYVSGNLRRAPRWLTDHGFEWFGRMVIEPRRLWKRYLLGLPIFFWRVARERARMRGAA